MRSRLAPFLVLVLLAAACAGPPSDEGSAEDRPAPVEQPAAGSEALGLFAYSYQPGDSYTFAFQMKQGIDVSIEAEGDSGFFEGEEPPGEVDATIDISGTVTYDVAPGPEPETFAVTISSTFDQVSVDGTVDGVPITDEFALEQAGVPNLVNQPDLTMYVDRQGNVLSSELDGDELQDFDLFANPFSSFEDITSGGLTGHFGPAFPPGSLRPGQQWGEEFSEQILDQTVTSNVTYTVAGPDLLGGHNVAVIDIKRTFSGVTIDFGQFFSALFSGLAEMGSELGGEPADSGTAQDLDFTFTMDMLPAEANGKAWFDQDHGITRQLTQGTVVAMSMDFAVDDGTQAGSVHMDMGFDVDLDVKLVD